MLNYGRGGDDALRLAELRLAALSPELIGSLLCERLTKKQKCYIILYYRDCLTMEQIASRCGVNRSTVSRTITRARRRLSEAIEADCIRKALKLTLGSPVSSAADTGRDTL
ncbi:MAG: hypothetical protein IKP47_05405 [Ruminococcus sp.]|nr:hypothetical protein [Ruminococcus sp.]